MSVRKGLIALAVAAMASVPAISANAAAGDPDPGFGTNGVLVSDLLDRTGAVDVDAQGRVIVAGVKGGLPAVARYTSTGQPDTTFSGDGVATYGFPSQFGGPVPLAVKALADGSVLAASADGLAVQAARFSGTGEQDLTYGSANLDGDDQPITGGVVVWESGSSISPQHASISSDGAITIVANVSGGGGTVWRADPAGTKGGGHFGYDPAIVPAGCDLWWVPFGAGSVVTLDATSYLVSFELLLNQVGGCPAAGGTRSFLLSKMHASPAGAADTVVWSVQLTGWPEALSDATSGLAVVGDEVLASAPLDSGSVFVRRSLASGAAVAGTARVPVPAAVETVGDMEVLTGGSVAVASGDDLATSVPTVVKVSVVTPEGTPDPAWTVADTPLAGGSAFTSLAATTDGGFFLGAATNAAGTVRKFQGPPPTPPTPQLPPSALSPLQPGRLLDTRTGGQTVDHLFEGQGIRPAGEALELQVGGRGGVPADADAAVLNVTVTGATGSGYVTAWPCGQPQPNASSLNFVTGSTVANAVIVKLGAGGKVCVVAAESATHLIADVNGYFPAGSGFEAVQPGRLLDTRAGGQTTDHAFEAQGIRDAGSILELQIGGRGGVAADATGVVLNVTVTGATGAGYLTVWPCGQPQPNASSLNYVTGSTVPNAVISQVGAGGKVCLFVAESATHLIADVNGYFPVGAGYSSLTPGRLLDTRTGGQTVDHLFEAQGIRDAGSTLELQVGGRGNVPANASAAVLNVTVTGATGSGYVTAWPCGEPQPNASSLNYVTGSTVPNAVVVKLGAGGKVCLFVAESATHLIADVNGYFPG